MFFPQNKRARSGTLLIAFLFLILLSVFSSAILKEDNYTIGQDVRIDLSHIEDYMLKITTPTKTLMRAGSDDVFLFNLDEIGKYNFKLISEEVSKTYFLEVVEDEVEDLELEDSFITPVNASEEIEKVEKKNIVENKSFEKQVENQIQNETQKIIAGEPVLQKKKINKTSSKVILELPYVAENVTLNGKEIETDSSVYSKVVSVVSEASATKEIVLENISEDSELEYYTPAPEVKESKIDEKNKEVVVYAPDYLEYKNVYTTINVSGNARTKEDLRIFWKEENQYLDFEVNDTDEDGFIDKLTFIVPHLSTQTFDIILISKAEHLDEDRNFIEDAYSEVSKIDNNQLLISEDEYLRVTFEEMLDYTKDITIYASSKDGADVEVYRRNSDDLLAVFNNVNSYSEYKIFLTNLESLEDTFDLKVVSGEVYFDYVVDPSFYTLDSDSFEDQNFVSDEGASWQTSTTGGTLDINNERASDGSYSMRAGNAGYVEQTAILPIDTTDFTNISVSFYYAETGGWEATDCFYFDWYDGSTWNNELTVCDDFPSGATFTLGDYDLSSAADDNSDFQIRFIHDNPTNGNAEELWVDNIIVRGYGNFPPILSSVVLNSTLETNMTTENLTCYPSAVDPDGDSINYIYNWFLNDSSYSILNLPFSEVSSDSYTKDYSNDNSVSISGAIFQTSGGFDGKGAYEFSGSGDYLSVSNMPGLMNGLSEITFSAWVKSDVTSTDNGILSSSVPDGSDSIFTMRYDAAGATGGGNNLIKIGLDSTGGQQQLESSSGVQTTDWQHLVFTWSSGNQIKLYINGQLDTPTANDAGLSGTLTGVTQFYLGLGGKDTIGSVGWDGLIDDVFVFDRELSQEEILNLYNANYDLIDSSETSVGDNWKCEVTPNDGFDEGISMNSSALEILPYTAPVEVGLDILYPLTDVNVYQNEFFNVTVNVSCVSGECGIINVTLDPVQETFEDFESSEGGFTHGSVDSGLDEWHRSSEYSNDGTYSFKVGDTGTGNYGDDANSYLQTPAYSLSDNSTFSFRHYLSTESSYDGGKLEYRLDGGSWTKVTSFISGDYTGTFNNWNSITDFTDSEDIWTGTIGGSSSFSLVEVDMSSFVGDEIEFRFRFASDTNTNDEGWYIDSVNFTTEIPGGTKGVIPMSSGEPFYTTSQNPYSSNYLNAGESQVIVFNVNATGELATTYEFFAYANSTLDISVGEVSPMWNVTITENLQPISFTVDSPTGTTSDLYPTLEIDILEGIPDSIWYNLNGGSNVTVCQGGCSVSGQSWGYSGFDYRLPINISGIGLDLTDYQVNLEINLTDYYNDGKLNSDCSDLRFADSSLNAIDYWIESCDVSGEDSSIWIKVPSILSASGATIYMYYGNSGASSLSDSNETFLIYDDFEDGIISNEWISYDIEDGAGFTSEANGFLNVTGMGADIWGTDDDQRLVSQELSGDFVMDAVLDSVDWASNAWAKASIIVKDSSTEDSNYALIGETMSNGVAFQYNYDGNVNGDSYSDPMTFRIIKEGSSVSVYYSSNGGTSWTQVGATQDVSVTDPVEVGFSSTSHTTTDYISAYWDSILVRSYSSTEPSLSLGTEEVFVSASDYSEILDIFSEGNFRANVYANNSNNEVVWNYTDFTIDLENNYYDSFNENYSISDFGDSIWEVGSLNYEGGPSINFYDGFEVYPTNFTGISGTANQGCTWYWDSDGTASGGTGPDSAHEGTYYAYVETSNGQGCYDPGDTATMESLEFNLTGSNATLSFWYHMYGADMGTLYIDAYDGIWTNLWSISGQQQSSESDAYLNQLVDLTGYSGTVQIRFRYIAAGDYQGDVAIDEVEVLETVLESVVVSKEITLVNPIAEFTNISWNYDSEGIGEVKINISADGGSSWSEAVNNLGLVSLTGGTDFLYKIIFSGTNYFNLSLLDLNFTWSNTASPAPDVNIVSPVSGTLNDVTPILEFSVTGGTANNVWYKINGGTSQNVCSNCNGNFDDTLYLEEGSYTITVYTDNSLGQQKSDSVSFTIDMNGMYNDTYLDDSQIWSTNGPWWEEGNVSYVKIGEGVLLNETFDFLNNWTLDGGTWELASGGLRQSSNSIDTFAINDLITLSSLEVYNISMEVYDDDNDETGIVFRYLDSSDYYICRYYLQTGDSALERIQGGAVTTLASISSDYTENAWNNYTVSIGENVSCYLNGVLVATASDDTWEDGKVGIYNSYHQNAIYDNFIVEEFPSESFKYFVSYPIRTLLDIVEVLNVSWNSYLENTDNNISVEISTDDGNTWHEIENGERPGVLEVDNDLVYRVKYYAEDSSLLSLLDMYIEWTHSASPAPTITITPPGTSVKDTTPVIESSINGPAQTFWYKINGGENKIICTDCSAGSYYPILYLEEGNYIINFYANNSVGAQTSSSVSFEVDMQRNYFDTYLDGSQIYDFRGAILGDGNISFIANGDSLYEDFESGALSSDWTVYNSNSYSQGIVGSAVAYDGTYSFMMDSTTNNNYELTELMTTKDFSGINEINLDFYWLESGDETNTASDHTGHQNADGVYYTCDGNQWYMVYNFAPASVTDNTWQNVNIDISSDADFCSTVDSNFAIKITQYDNYIWGTDGIAIDNINITTPGGKTSVVSHAINVSQNIRRISEATWNTFGVDVNNPLTVELSVDNGNNWMEIINGGSLDSFSSGNSLVYRLNFSASENREMSILDLNITWEEPPSIDIQYPENDYVYNYPITKMNYTVYVSGSETIDSCWWTNNSGVTNDSVICGQDILTTSVDGVNVWTIYANDSAGTIGSDSVQFIIDTSAPTIVFLNQSSDPVDEGGEFLVNVNVSDSNTESVWIIIWEGVVGGTARFSGFLTDFLNGVFGGGTTIDSEYELINNYTVYANDTTGLISNYTGSFEVLKMFFSPTNPIYTDGISPIFVTGSLGLSSGGYVINHPFNIWFEGEIVPFENFTSDASPVETLNFSGQGELFSSSQLINVSDAGGYLTLTGTNTSGSMRGVLDAGAYVDWGMVDWDLLSGSCSDSVNYYDGNAWGYFGTEDAYIDSGSSTTNYGSEIYLNLDTSPTVQRTLVKFDSIFGYGLNKIPYDSTISSATLSSTVYTPGNAPTLYEILEDWDEDEVTYNGRLSGVSWSSTGVAGSPSRSTSPLGIISTTTTGTKSLDITNLVRNWNNQTSENYGIVFNPGGSSGVQIRSSEYDTTSERPRLDVSFSSSSCAGIEVYYRTSKDGTIWSDWNEVFIGEEIGDEYGLSRYLEYKVLFGSYDGAIKPNLWDIEFDYNATVTDSSGEFNYSFEGPSDFGVYSINLTSGLRTIYANEEVSVRVQSGINPVVDLLWPEDGYWSQDADVTIEYNATDLNGDLAEASLFVDGVFAKNNESVMINGQNDFDYTFSEGCHNYSIVVEDFTGLTDESENRTICVDLVDPIVSLLSPGDGTSYTVGYLNLSFFINDNLDNNLTCNVTLDSVNIFENYEFLNGTIINVSSGALTGGMHYWNVSCMDDSLRYFTTTTYDFEITDTPPSVTLSSPVNNSVSSSNEVNFTFVPEDNSGITSCNLYIDGIYSGNVTSPLTGKNSTISVGGITDGFHDWSVSCWDLSSSVASSANWTFGVDTTGPVIELFNLLDGSISYDATPDFDVRITDAIDSELSCDLLVDSSVLESFNATSGNRFNFTPTNWFLDGVYSWQINCSDDSGYYSTTVARSIDIRESPTIAIENSNESFVSSSDFGVSFVPSDNDAIDSCSLYINGILNTTSSSITQGISNLFEPSGFLNGVYSYYVSCQDAYGNIGRSLDYVMTLDTVSPSLEALYPLNENVYAQDITFNFSASDEYASELNCSINIDGSFVEDGIIVSNSTNVSRIISGISDGTHWWNFTCYDLAGNYNTSETYNFTRFTAPGINLVSPDNETWLNDSDVSFVYYPMDDEGISKAELFLNSVLEDDDTSVTANVNNQFDINLEDGVYDWYVRVTDTSLMPQDSEVRRVYVDTETPTLILGLPVQDQVYNKNGVDFNFTVSDNLDLDISCQLYLGGDLEWSGEVSNGTEEIVNLLLIDGNHSYFVNCSDEAGNKIISNEINFTVYAPPVIELTSPASGIFTTNSSINFSYIPWDDLGLIECNIYLDDVLEDTSFAIVPNVENNFTINGISEGYHNWNVSCTDSDMNIAASGYNYFSRDINAPTINLNSPEDGIGIDANTGSVSFSWTAIDELDGFFQCDLIVDSVVEENDAWVTNATMVTKSVSGLGIGTHYWNVTCWDRVGNIDTSTTRNFSLSYPEFVINNTLLNFNSSSYNEGDTARLDIVIKNQGGVDSENVPVYFYDDDPSDGGIRIKSDSLYIGANSENTSFVEFETVLGVNKIFVVVDEEDNFVEGNEDNNEANTSVTVGSWQFFYGDISSESDFTLSEEGGEVLTWDIENYNDGNIFVSDSESSISWMNLEAIGKRLNGFNTSDDFSEIDNALGMQEFDDSISELFYPSGIKTTEDFVVFNKIINEVPITNSTDNENFVTGILWDSSTDSTGEYDSSEYEELVFVTKVNPSSAGKFGNYDYELRVPAKLREYDSFDEQKVVFYLELF